MHADLELQRRQYLKERYTDIQKRILQALNRTDKRAVRLVAVSKRQHPDDIRILYELGQRDFAESYLQEAIPKIEALNDLDIVWHFIGPVQSNKTRLIATAFDWVHSVSREKIAQRLATQRQPDQDPLNICIQVNISRESIKSGLDPEMVDHLSSYIQELDGPLRLRGIMAIPENQDDPKLIIQRFREMRHIFNKARENGLPMDMLSMGMSNDFEQAIMCGANMIRIGTALFGRRDR